MRRKDIIRSIESLRTAIIESDITKALHGAFARNENIKSGFLLGALNRYSIAATKFDAETRELTRIFGIDGLEDASNWEQILDDSKEQLVNYYSKCNAATTYLPKFAGLLHQKGPEEYLETVPSNRRTDLAISTVSVILLENDREFSTPERVIEILQATTEIYSGLALMLGKSTDSLSVLSCDSGSDKSFDFLGLASVMTAFKELVISLWDRVVFFKERRVKEQIDTIAQGLPVLARIAELESTNAIGPEQAEIIRRFIVGGSTRFIKAGAIIPEIQEHTYHEPRALMSPERKMLMPPEPDSTPPNSSAEVQPPPFNQEMAELRARLQRLEHQGIAPEPEKRSNTPTESTE